MTARSGRAIETGGATPDLPDKGEENARGGGQSTIA